MGVYIIKTGKVEMQLSQVKILLGQSYWANTRDNETIEKSIDNSLCYGSFLEENGRQIGFARVITDYATAYYICDVIVEEQYRGIGIGKALLDAIHANEEISSLKGILATTNAHELYRKYGFQEGGNTYMARPRK